MNRYFPLRWALAILALFCCSVQAHADWVELRCYPKDCEVFRLQEGLSDVSLGLADQPLQLVGGERLRLQRDGWESLEIELPSNLSSLFPDSHDPLQLKVRDGGGLARACYLFGQGWWTLCFLIPVPFLVGKLRSKAVVESSDSHLEDLDRLKGEVLETGPLSFQVLGDYVLLDPIDEGGASLVYRAVLEKSPMLGMVAVKILKRHLTQDPSYLKRWKREIQITSELEHRGLVKLLASGESGPHHFLVTELLEGQPLSKHLSHKGIPWTKAIDYVLPVMEGLQLAHEAGIVHRDIKPENIIVTTRGQSKLIDFGIARGDDFTIATQTGMAMGTPHYMSPEQILGEVHPSSDQYGVGVLLYELISGRPPFDGEGVEIIMKHSGTQAKSLLESNPELPEPVDQVIQKMLAKRPEQRFPSIEAAAQELREIRGRVGS